jgi:transcriptional regulator NrdR family protein
MAINADNNNIPTGNTSMQQDEGLKQVVVVIKEVWGILRKYFLVLIFPIVLLSVYGYFQAKKQQVSYIAKITFFISEERPQIPGFGGGSFSNILQTTNNNFNNPKKLKEYSFTEKVGSKLLFKRYVFKGKEDFLANHYLKLYSGYKESYFKTFTKVEDLNHQDYLTFKGILVGIKSMVTIDYNEAEIYSITVSASDEAFSKLLCNAFYENLIAYYIERATTKAKITVDFLEEKLAYVKAQLENSEYNLADYKDKANNLVTFKAELDEIRYVRNKSLLEAMYQETARGLEASKTNLQSIMPLFQTIDEPHLPLQRIIVNSNMQMSFYALFGLVIDILFIALVYLKRHYWQGLRDLFKENKPTTTVVQEEPANI